jgi:hypothetical protein
MCADKVERSDIDAAASSILPPSDGRNQIRADQEMIIARAIEPV